MSLDVYLRMPGAQVKPRSGIFIRENGAKRQISRQEWDARYPDREPFQLLACDEETDEVYSDNITHNLNIMAREAGIYKHLWRPDEIGVTQAEQLIEPLMAGLNTLRSDPDKFKAFNPDNGWGDYDGLCSFVEGYLVACQLHPAATVEVSR